MKRFSEVIKIFISITFFLYSSTMYGIDLKTKTNNTDSSLFETISNPFLNQNQTNLSVNFEMATNPLVLKKANGETLSLIKDLKTFELSGILKIKDNLQIGILLPFEQINGVLGPYEASKSYLNNVLIEGKIYLHNNLAIIPLYYLPAKNQIQLQADSLGLGKTDGGYGAKVAYGNKMGSTVLAAQIGAIIAPETKFREIEQETKFLVSAGLSKSITEKVGLLAEIFSEKTKTNTPLESVLALNYKDSNYQLRFGAGKDFNSKANDSRVFANLTYFFAEKSQKTSSETIEIPNVEGETFEERFKRLKKEIDEENSRAKETSFYLDRSIRDEKEYEILKTDLDQYSISSNNSPKRLPAAIAEKYSDEKRVSRAKEKIREAVVLMDNNIFLFDKANKKNDLKEMNRLKVELSWGIRVFNKNIDRLKVFTNNDRLELFNEKVEIAKRIINSETYVTNFEVKEVQDKNVLIRTWISGRKDQVLGVFDEKEKVFILGDIDFDGYIQVKPVSGKFSSYKHPMFIKEDFLRERTLENKLGILEKREDDLIETKENLVENSKETLKEDLKEGSVQNVSDVSLEMSHDEIIKAANEDSLFYESLYPKVKNKVLVDTKEESYSSIVLRIQKEEELNNSNKIENNEKRQVVENKEEKLPKIESSGLLHSGENVIKREDVSLISDLDFSKASYAKVDSNEMRSNKEFQKETHKEEPKETPQENKIASESLKEESKEIDISELLKRQFGEMKHIPQVEINKSTKKDELKIEKISTFDLPLPKSENVDIEIRIKKDFLLQESEKESQSIDITELFPEIEDSGFEVKIPNKRDIFIPLYSEVDFSVQDFLKKEEEMKIKELENKEKKENNERIPVGENILTTLPEKVENKYVKQEFKIKDNFETKIEKTQVIKENEIKEDADLQKTSVEIFEEEAVFERPINIPVKPNKVIVEEVKSQEKQEIQEVQEERTKVEVVSKEMESNKVEISKEIQIEAQKKKEEVEESLSLEQKREEIESKIKEEKLEIDQYIELKIKANEDKIEKENQMKKALEMKKKEEEEIRKSIEREALEMKKKEEEASKYKELYESVNRDGFLMEPDEMEEQTGPSFEE